MTEENNFIARLGEFIEKVGIAQDEFESLEKTDPIEERAKKFIEFYKLNSAYLFLFELYPKLLDTDESREYYLDAHKTNKILEKVLYSNFTGESIEDWLD